jgi:DNA polymerase
MQTDITHRQAAMLQDMGIDVWLPRDAEDPVDTALQAAATKGSQGDVWQSLQAEVKACQRCDLAATRTQTVFGVGDPHADLMFIGEAPGAEEDKQGEPFVGRAGQLLNDPDTAQIEACSSYLDAQIAYVQPKLIVALGRFAAHRLLNTDAPVWRMREADNVLPGSNIPLVVTYHPASLLRNPDNKLRVWQDLCKVRKLLS